MKKLKMLAGLLVAASLSYSAITGKVVNDSGVPLSGATVQLFAQGSIVTTNTAGEFSLTYQAPVPTVIKFPPAAGVNLTRGVKYAFIAEGTDLVWSYDQRDDKTLFEIGRGNNVIFTFPTSAKAAKVNISCAGRGGHQLFICQVVSSGGLPSNVTTQTVGTPVIPKLLTAIIKDNALRLSLQKPSPVSVALFDLSGKKVFSSKQQLNQGEAIIPFPADREGSFNVVRVESNEGFITLRSIMGKGYAISEYSSAKKDASRKSTALIQAAIAMNDFIAVTSTGYAPSKIGVTNGDSTGMVIAMKKTNAAPQFVASYPKLRYNIDNAGRTTDDANNGTLTITTRFTDADNTPLTLSVGPGTTLPSATIITIANGANATEKKVSFKSSENDPDAGMYILQLAVSDGYDITTIDVLIAIDNTQCCPYVYLWDKDKSDYCYYTDLSGSPISKAVDFFKSEYYGENIYELGNYKAHDGVYRMKLREVINESCYFDQVKLLCVDVPAGYDVYNEWSFTSQLNAHPSRKFQAVRNLRAPLSAVDSKGNNVVRAVSAADGIPLKADEKTKSQVELDFGPLTNPEFAKLVVTGWGYYSDFSQDQKPPYSAGITIETKDANGKWVERKVSGKCSGDSRTWVIDIANILKKDNSRFRLTMAHNPSVLDILDAVRLDESAPVAAQVTNVPMAKADLKLGGAATVVNSTFSSRNLVKNDSLPLKRSALIEGDYTRYGDVRPLLTTSDDRFVIMAHGDEIVAEFKEPPKKAGFDRKVFLLADVYYTLQTHPLNAMQVTKSIEPLPFHGMKTYPYEFSLWPYTNDKNYQQYLTKWNTRKIAAPVELVKAE